MQNELHLFCTELNRQM